MATSHALPSIASEGNLARYLQEIRKFPMLEPDEEYMLAKRWKEDEDPQAAHRLVTRRWAASGSSASFQALASMYSSSGSSIGNLRISWR